MSNRLKSFLWRAGAFVVVALAGYLMNLGDVREVDPWTLGTIFMVTLSTFVFNEVTKHLNTKSELSTVSSPKKIASKKKS